jgi:dTMP kinase
MKGKLIVIESGTDSSGKATQTKKLYERLEKEAYIIKKVEYPNYESDSSALIKMYLNGEFGDDPSEVNPYASSSFYAVDRYASYKKNWKNFYSDGGIILADRYTTSNMIHQASKIEDRQQREEYLAWLREFEFEKIELPVPDMVVFLNMPPEVSIRLMANRANKFTGGQAKDIHEKNREYLKKTYENAYELAKKYNWTIIECTEYNRLKTIDEIHNEIYEKVKKVLESDKKK